MSHINEMMTLFLVCSSCWIRINISSRFHLSSLLSAAEKQDVNLMPYLISCVKNKVTLGEINDTFKEIFGIYVPKISF
jgi:methylmalonyl-CoA mutase N-terminal domain/subunit